MSTQFPRGEPVEGWKGAKEPARKALLGRHVRLEPLSAAHFDAVYRALAASPAHDWYYMPIGPFDSPQDLAEGMGQFVGNNDPFFFAIMDRQGQNSQGFLSYLNINPQGGSIEIGYIQLALTLQRTAGATEALWLLMRQAFDLGYRRLEWKCDSLNARSRQAARRFGFNFEGIFKQARVVKGRNRDTAWFSITDKEWRSLAPIYDGWFNRIETGAEYHPLSALTAPLARKPDGEI